MKTYMILSCVIFVLIMFTSCDVNQVSESSSEEQVPSTLEQTEQKNKWGRSFHRNGRTVPFKAKFFTSQNTDESGVNSVECPDPDFNFYNVQEGSGHATHLGKFTTRITFCVNVNEFPIPYKNGKGTFIAANGDKLFYTISGLVKPHDNPNDKYELEFQDPFTFTGGTGRFEGAEGNGMTDSLVDLLEEGGDRTDHIWKAKLILPLSDKR